MILSKESIAFLEHYGVKGMRWGVRKDRKSGGRSSGVSVAKKVGTALLIGNPNTSLVTKKGRENAKKDIASGKAAISKLTSGKAKKKVRKEPWEMSEEEWKTEIKTTKKLVAGILVATAGVKLANIVIQRQYEKMIWDSAVNSMAFTILETAGKK